MKCPDCGNPMLLKKGRFGYFYGCTRYPDCEGTHSAQSNGVPVGEPGDKETRQLRKTVHQELDRLWRTSRQRTLAYQWLANRLDVGMKECHIGRFNKAQCNRALAALHGATIDDISGWQKARRSFREVPHSKKRRRQFRRDPEADIHTRRLL